MEKSAIEYLVETIKTCTGNVEFANSIEKHGFRRNIEIKKEEINSPSDNKWRKINMSSYIDKLPTDGPISDGEFYNFLQRVTIRLKQPLQFISEEHDCVNTLAKYRKCFGDRVDGFIVTPIINNSYDKVNKVCTIDLEIYYQSYY